MNHGRATSMFIIQTKPLLKYLVASKDMFSSRYRYFNVILPDGSSRILEAFVFSGFFVNGLVCFY